MLSPRRLRTIVETLSAMPHVQTIRIHSRVPVADPERLTDELAGGDGDRPVDVAGGPCQSRARVHAGGGSGAAAGAGVGNSVAWPVGVVAWRKRQLGRAGGVVPSDDRASDEAVLFAPVGCRAGDRSVSRSDRGRARTAGGIARAGNRAGMANLRAGYSRRAWKSAGRAGLPARRMARCGMFGGGFTPAAARDSGLERRSAVPSERDQAAWAWEFAKAPATKSHRCPPKDRLRLRLS